LLRVLGTPIEVQSTYVSGVKDLGLYHVYLNNGFMAFIYVDE